MVNALPTIATATFVALLAHKGDSESVAITFKIMKKKDSRESIKYRERNEIRIKKDPIPRIKQIVNSYK